MIIIIITILKYTILSYVLSDMFNIFYELKFYTKSKILQFLISKTYCWKCLSFWLTLIATCNIFIAATVSIISIIITTIKNRLKI